MGFGHELPTRESGRALAKQKEGKSRKHLEHARTSGPKKKKPSEAGKQSGPWVTLCMYVCVCLFCAVV